jgi:hypothetical protein
MATLRGEASALHILELAEVPDDGDGDGQRPESAVGGDFDRRDVAHQPEIEGHAAPDEMGHNGQHHADLGGTHGAGTGHRIGMRHVAL